MGRIITQVRITNALDPSSEIRCDALVDTGAAPLVLPRAWRDRLGKLASSQTQEFEVADQRIISGEVAGPVQIQIEGFRSIHNEVVFLDMEPVEGRYEPLVGYLILEQSLAAVDMVGHRLVPVKHFDLK
ncbi:MAG: aspartyl protease family protein [Candidatus Binatia bacterium]